MLAVGPAGARAHSFTVVFVGSFAGPAAAVSKQMLDGFLLATRQQDAHADEESDGHLGGVDVYVVPLDEAGNAGSLPATRGAAAAKDSDAVFVTGLVSCVKSLSALRRRFPARATFVGTIARGGSVAGISVWRREGGTAANRQFVKSFKSAYGYPPTPAAAQGYDAARLIASAVRGLGGAFERASASALADALMRSGFRSVRQRFRLAGPAAFGPQGFLVGAVRAASGARPPACH